ncbi:MAG: 4Fe-4S ferredoxin [Candidatus Coatesbacteria bacterium]|nr:4Fe-4S ferredoxin [Candidatus Coatesbacteria bacterium]
MGVTTDKRLCDNCPGRELQLCVAACPGNLIDIDPQLLRAFCRDQRACRLCLACVKACPRGALTPVLPVECAPVTVEVRIETVGGGLRWTLRPDAEDELILTTEAAGDDA